MTRRALTAAGLLLALLLLALFLLPYMSGMLYPVRYEETVERHAAEYGVPSNLVLAVILTESDFRPEATSPAGACGLMQLMPATFRWLSDDLLGECLPAERIYDPEVNIRYGVYYLSLLYRRFGDWATACAAYNAGPGTVDGWLADESLTDGDGKLLPEKIPYPETRAYLPALRAAYDAYARRRPADVPHPFE